MYTLEVYTRYREGMSRIPDNYKFEEKMDDESTQEYLDEIYAFESFANEGWRGYTYRWKDEEMAKLTSNQSENETVWFVREGVMYSGWVIAKLAFEYQVIDGADDPRHIGYFLKGNGDTTNSIPSGLINMAERPGVWFLLSGMRIVHGDDIYLSKESAAKAEFDRLMGDDE